MSMLHLPWSVHVAHLFNQLNKNSNKTSYKTAAITYKGILSYAYTVFDCN